ncbi:outer membrane protein assembly factor BamA [Frigidibacter mobilis]|uniref:Outer membrane protein assembly factor BamA n=1 Tax=Frigidibacter mobilis TaxID=1335048 RepID=A0A159Z4I8_9RHOB|nr:outer membrane protein assembly factor BamA [Frigidibacter mobilis]AMY69180.1 outer membrane protein assembly factor YaeT [Frigidibacter mobilis]
MATKLSSGGSAPEYRPAMRRAGLLLSVAMLCTASLTPVQAQTYSFSQVQIEGNSRIDDGTILSYAGIGRGEAVSAGALNDAYQRIIASGQFENVELVPSGGTLVIRVTEYPIVNVVDFEGNARIKDEQLSAAVKTTPRRVFSPQQVEADAAAIASAYAGGGRVAARVNPKVIRRDANSVDVVFEISEGRLSEIERLSFTGNRAFSDRRLREVLDTKQAGLLRIFVGKDTYAPDRIEFDKQLLTDFYRSRGYVDFQVLGVASEFSRERDAFFLTYNVQEGQSFKFGQVRTVSEVEGLNPADFDRAVKVRPGATYSPNAVDNTISRMEAVALEKGLSFVRIEPRVTRNERTRTLDIDFVVANGPRVFVERIDIEGNATTLDKVVRRQFRTVEGDPFNPREIREAAARIKALGFFSATDVDTRQGSAQDRVIVDVNVTEQPTGSLSFGVSYGVDAGVGLALSFSEQNFLGRGQFFSASLNTTSSTGSSSITFVEPAFMDRDLALRLSAYYRISENDNSDYSMKLAGIEPSIEFPIAPNTRLNLGFKIGQEELYDIDADSSSAILVAEEGKQDSFGLSYALSYDNRRTGLNPNGGIRLRFGQELYGLAGDVEALKTTALATAETKVFNEEWTLRAELEGGAYTALNGTESRVTDRFFAGGMRGFESRGIGPRDLDVENEDPLGGNYYAVARFEAEFPLGIPEEYGITGGLFLDVGSVWGLDTTDGGLSTGCNDLDGDGVCQVDDGISVRAAVGFSVFWTTPIGPLRFNFSKALAKEDYDVEQNFDLTVSTRF